MDFADATQKGREITKYVVARAKSTERLRILLMGGANCASNFVLSELRCCQG